MRALLLALLLVPTAADATLSITCEARVLGEGCAPGDDSGALAVGDRLRVAVACDLENCFPNGDVHECLSGPTPVDGVELHAEDEIWDFEATGDTCEFQRAPWPVFEIIVPASGAFGMVARAESAPWEMQRLEVAPGAEGGGCQQSPADGAPGVWAALLALVALRRARLARGAG